MTAETGPAIYEPTPEKPLTPEEQHVWTTVFLAEACRASEASIGDRIDRAYDLADDATVFFRIKMAECRPPEDTENDENEISANGTNDANQDCRGV